MTVAAIATDRRDFGIAVAAMALVVVASNVLVQYPVEAFGLAEVLTYGAFTYPLAFFVTDLTNRRFGPARARKVVAVGFAIAVVMSLALADWRIAVASGTAFLVAQLLDIQIFDRLRAAVWWLPPFVSSVIASAVDTVLFFSIAFAGVADMSIPVMGPFGEWPLWANLGFYDYLVKLALAAAFVAPYGAALRLVRPAPAPGLPAR
jgi:hypothetical protein